MEHDTYRRWLDLEVEGELPESEAERLAEHLAGCPDCRAERRLLVALRDGLDEARVPVRAGFRKRVIEALPEPDWRPRAAARSAWRPAVALLLVLGALSAFLFAGAGSGLAPAAPLAGAAAAVVELMGAALVTGAGLLAASWAGVGMAVGEIFSTSPATLLAFAALLLFLSLLVAGLLRRPRVARQRAGGDRGGRSPD